MEEGTSERNNQRFEKNGFWQKTNWQLNILFQKSDHLENSIVLRKNGNGKTWIIKLNGKKGYNA